MNKNQIKHLLDVAFMLVAIGCLFCFVGCQNKNTSPILRVAATSIPHAEILEFVKSDLEAQNIQLDVMIVEDYNTPNRALTDKEVDANFFQHLPFLEMQMADFGYLLEPLMSVHIEPMALYSKRVKRSQDLKLGALIAIPSDPSNQARALCLLESQGLIGLRRADGKTTLFDVVENPLQLRWIEIDSPLLARTLDDVEAAAITTNFALQADLDPLNDALLMEDQQSPFKNIVVIRKGDADRKEIQALKHALGSEKVKLFLENRYKGAVVPAFF
jgi:D-methionine transport system substrate-binding protein